jgi:hypothetical protein
VATGSADSGRYSNWSATEPNDTNANEDCGEIRPTGWNDEACDQLRPYLCERFPVPAGCYDALPGGTETDVDCGGSCGTCPKGSACSTAADCDTQHCLNSLCVEMCTDGVKDGTETDVDCGGTCAKCGLNKICSVNGDCASGTCTSGMCSCVAASCPNCLLGLGTKCCKTDGTCGCITPPFPGCQ